MRIDPLLSHSDRRKQLETEFKISCPEIGSISFDKDEQVHCENLIGGTVLPLGVAGPLVIHGVASGGEYIVPLATTEGALVASVNRGCKAIRISGGAQMRSEKTGVTRGPVFEVDSMEEAFTFRDWVEANLTVLKEQAEKTSSHLKLLKAETKISGRYVFIRFYFLTGDAMGMNMVTLGTERIVKFIEREKHIKCIALSGNYCVDKKPSYLNFISGKGQSVWGEIVLTKEALNTVLKTDAQRIFDVWLAKSVMGSVISGTMGNSAHFANIVAAFYAATGQDLAHVVEGSLGVTTAKILSQDNLYFSIYMPSVMVGTVGGGTKLKIKKEALSILRVTDSSALAEVLGGVVLAGELSLLASLAQGTLADAHRKLGR